MGLDLHPHSRSDGPRSDFKFSPSDRFPPDTLFYSTWRHNRSNFDPTLNLACRSSMLSLFISPSLFIYLFISLILCLPNLEQIPGRVCLEESRNMDMIIYLWRWRTYFNSLWIESPSSSPATNISRAVTQTLVFSYSFFRESLCFS